MKAGKCSFKLRLTDNKLIYLLKCTYLVLFEATVNRVGSFKLFLFE